MVKQVVGALGVSVVFVVALLASTWLCARLPGVGMVAFAVVLGAAWVATSESQAMAQKVGAALRSLGWSLKEAAIRAEMGEPQLCRQLNGIEQMSLSRFAAWGPEFEIALGVQLLKSRGYAVIEKAQLVVAKLEVRS